MASSDARQIKRNAASRALLRNSGIWRRGVGGTSATTPAAITCLYPLNCTDAEVIALGGEGAIPATDATYQEFVYTTNTSEFNSRRVAPADFGSPAQATWETTGKRVFEVGFTSNFSGTETGFVTVQTRVYFGDTQSYWCSATANTSGVYGLVGLSGAVTWIGMLLDYDTGTYKLYQDGVNVAEEVLAEAHNTAPYFFVSVIPDSITENGNTLGISVRTSKDALLGTYPAGTMTLCGEVL